MQPIQIKVDVISKQYHTPWAASCPLANLLFRLPILKSDNIQYNTLGCWVHGTNNSSTKCLMFQVFFFIKSCNILCKNPFNLFFLFFYKITKMKIKSFECRKSIRNYEKNTWNVKRLVDDSFVPSAQQTSVLYSRLTDFRSKS